MVGNIKRPKKLVLDASAVLSELMADERTPSVISRIIDRFSNGEVEIYAPTILIYEVANSLRSAIVSNRVSKKVAKRTLREFLNLTIIYKEIDFEKALKESLKSRLSIYDASYLVLSKQINAPIVSLDKKLIKLSK